MSLPAGPRDRQITIERAATIDDGYQTRPGVWTTLITRWASYKPAPGSERFEAASQGASQPATFRIGWSALAATVTPRDRLRSRGVVWEIRAVAEIGRRKGIELICLSTDDGSGGDA